MSSRKLQRLLLLLMINEAENYKEAPGAKNKPGVVHLNAS